MQTVTEAINFKSCQVVNIEWMYLTFLMQTKIKQSEETTFQVEQAWNLS